MPRVPTFGGVPTVNLATGSPQQFGAPRTVPVPGDPGAALQQQGQDIMGLGAQIAKREQHEKDKLSTAFAKTSYNSLRVAAAAEFGAFKGLKNADALKGKEAAMKRVTGEYDRIYKGMTDDAARDAFEAAAGGLLASVQIDIDEHARVQSDAFQSEANRTHQGLSEADAIKSWVASYDATASQDPNQIGPPAPAPAPAGSNEPAQQVPGKIGPPAPPVSGEQFANAAVADAEEEAYRQGIPPDSDVFKAIVSGVRSRINEGVVEALSAQGKFDDAEEHLAGSLAHGEFDPEAAAKMQGKIRERRVADVALKQVVEWDVAGVSMSARVGATRAAFASGQIDADAYRAVMEEVGKSEKTSKEINSAMKAEGVTAAQRFFNANAMASIDDFKRALPEEYEKAVANGGLPEIISFSGKRDANNPQAVVRAQSMTAEELSAYSRQEIVNEFYSLLDESNLKDLLTRHESATSGGGSGTKAGLELFSRDEKLRIGFANVYKHRLAEEHGDEFDYNDKAKMEEFATAQMFLEFRTKLQAKIEKFESDNKGKKATDDDLDDMIADMELDVAKKRNTFSSDVNVNINAVTKEERALLYVETPTGPVSLSDLDKDQEAEYTRQAISDGQKWLKDERAKGKKVNEYDIPKELRPTQNNIISRWIHDRAPGAKKDSSASQAVASLRYGPNPAVPFDRPTPFPTAAYNFGEVSLLAKEAKKRNDAFGELRREIYRKYKVPTVQIQHFLVEHPVRAAADAELDKRWKEMTDATIERAHLDRLIASTGERKETIRRLNEEADVLTKQFGNRHPAVTALVRQRLDLELLDVKIQSARTVYGPLEETEMSLDTDVYGPEEAMSEADTAALLEASEPRRKEMSNLSRTAGEILSRPLTPDSIREATRLQNKFEKLKSNEKHMQDLIERVKAEKAK